MWAAIAPEAVRRFVAERVVPALPGRAHRYAQRSFLGDGLHAGGRRSSTTSPGIRLRDQRALLAGRLRSLCITAERAYGTSRAWLDRAASRPWLERVLYADLKTYLVELLMKQDQMSMAASIESRVPFLDHRLVEFAATMPSSLKLSGFTHEARARVGGTRPPARLDAQSSEDGLSSAVRRVDAPGVARSRSGTCCSIGARGSAACSTCRP